VGVSRHRDNRDDAISCKVAKGLMPTCVIQGTHFVAWLHKMLQWSHSGHMPTFHYFMNVLIVSVL